MLIYLGLSALAASASALLLLLFGEPPLLAAMHLVFAVAILPLILGAIAHFVPVLTRSASAPRTVLLAPLLLQLSGLFVVLHFSGILGSDALQVAADVALLTAIAFAGWLVVRARGTLGKPHPGWRWYLAATALLVIGLALVPAMYYWPESRQNLRLLHLHINTLGFVGLTAIGTLRVLMPTILSGPDAEATVRLRRDLPLAVVAVLAIALGAAFWWPLALLGSTGMAIVVCRLGSSWWRRYGLRSIVSDGASASLAAALFGFLLLLVLGSVHGLLGFLSGHDVVLAFVALFLLPLVTGALSQLLPVWRYPGRRTPERDHVRKVLVQGGALRAVVFLVAGLFLSLGYEAGYGLAAIGLLWFALQIIRGLGFSGK